MGKSLEKKRHKLDVKRFKHERERERFLDTDNHYFSNRGEERDYTSQLLEVVKYLNVVKDGFELKIVGDLKSRTITQAGRQLNSHEDDLYNAALLTLKRIIAAEPLNGEVVEMVEDDEDDVHI